jgi:hypothetical protein
MDEQIDLPFSAHNSLALQLIAGKLVNYEISKEKAEDLKNDTDQNVGKSAAASSIKN